MAKGGITWTRLTDEGTRLEVNAHLVGSEWRFTARHGRYDDWKPMAAPTEEDWDELVDGVERRVTRGLMKAEQLRRLHQEVLRRLGPFR